MGKSGQYKDQEECAGMKYGYFDDKKREYVITRPDTPAPWVNYLGDRRSMVPLCPIMQADTAL